MPYDAAAEALLDQVMKDWEGRGILGTLRSVVTEVWPRNQNRFETQLGDDNMVLGVQSSRNIQNLAVARLQERDVEAAIVEQSLQVKYAGRVLHIGKAPSTATAWSIDKQRWDDSEVRQLGAKANSQAYYPAEGALFPVRAGEPAALKHLHLTWQGLDGGITRAWVGFPRAGDLSWFAVAPLAAADPLQRPVLPSGPALPPAPNFDAMAEPETELKLKPRSGEREGQRPASGEQS
ncbi:hypothetical protein GCU67_20930 [Modestobacter muralis]|uniref:Uncharacterized protein n=1 Tax=Modestobacter muralis TaxID=1608614 RepID=A0A6P0HD16_9ACTN|nr:hypothetical protein [Modestobacter muralis]NEK96611.1 hypothetical protein [Modestobacter muralis]NEN53530.1 hypothetical protein [Modestobacter muralis]